MSNEFDSLEILLQHYGWHSLLQEEKEAPVELVAAPSEAEDQEINQERLSFLAFPVITTTPVVTPPTS